MRLAHEFVAQQRDVNNPHWSPPCPLSLAGQQ
jgi:hypothetical protein